MRKRNAGRLVVLALAATTVLVGSALPAVATVSSYNVRRDSGRIGICRFGTVCVSSDVPGNAVAGCPGSDTISGTIDDAGGVDTINGTLSVSSPFTYGTGTYILTINGTATGTNSGNWSGGTFTGMQFNGATFSIRNFNPIGCATGTQICGSSGSPATTNGTLNLTMSGGVVPGSTVPLSTGEKLYVNATGSLSNAGCITGSTFALIVVTGASATITDNPSDCYLGPCPDPGAIFAQWP